jgi:hypothetical protein
MEMAPNGLFHLQMTLKILFKHVLVEKKSATTNVMQFIQYATSSYYLFGLIGI